MTNQTKASSEADARIIVDRLLREAAGILKVHPNTLRLWEKKEF